MILQAEPPTSRAAIMASNTAASMFGGAGGRGSRASVSSPQGLRNMLRKDEREPGADQAKPAASGPPDNPDAPADDKHTLRGLNDRLSGYLGKVKRLEKENADLEKEIDEILAKRKTPEGRDWDKTEEPLEDLKKQVGPQKVKQIWVNSEGTSQPGWLFYGVLLCLGEGRHHGQRQAAAPDRQHQTSSGRLQKQVECCF